MINPANNSHLFQNLQAESGHAKLILPGRHIAARESMYDNGCVYIVFTILVLCFLTTYFY
jgi:hypothetical protein